jgi:hypothetical protein
MMSRNVLMRDQIAVAMGSLLGRDAGLEQVRA